MHVCRCRCICTMCITHANSQLAADVLSWTDWFHDLLVCGFATSTDCFPTSVPSSKEPLIAKPSFLLFPIWQMASVLLYISSFFPLFVSSSSFLAYALRQLAVVNPNGSNDKYFISFSPQGFHWNFRFLRNKIDCYVAEYILCKWIPQMNGWHWSNLEFVVGFLEFFSSKRVKTCFWRWQYEI